MRKVLVSLCCVFFVYAQPTIQEKDISKDFCGDDPYCFVYQYIVKQTKNLEETYKIIFEYFMKQAKGFSFDSAAENYKIIQDFTLPKIGETFEKVEPPVGYKEKCIYKITRESMDTLTVEFNQCQSEWHTVTFKKKDDYYEVIHHIVAGG